MPSGEETGNAKPGGETGNAVQLQSAEISTPDACWTLLQYMAGPQFCFPWINSPMQWLDPDWAFLVYWMANVWTWVLLLKPACVQHRTMAGPWFNVRQSRDKRQQRQQKQRNNRTGEVLSLTGT